MKVDAADGASLPGLFPSQENPQSRENYIQSVLGGTYHDASETLKFFKLALKKFLNTKGYSLLINLSTIPEMETDDGISGGVLEILPDGYGFLRSVNDN